MYKNRGKTIIMWIAAALILLLLLALAAGWVWNTYRVQDVQVKGNYHYNDDEIREMVMKGPLGENSLYLSLRYKNRDVTDIPFVDVLNVTILSPDAIQIEVYEKALAGYVKYMDTYMYFDKDGYVVECSGIKIEGIPQIAGMSFDSAVLGKPLPVENEEIFERILNLTKLINKYKLTTDKIFFHSDGEITVYFGGIKVVFDHESTNIEEHFMVLPDFLKELEGKSGTLQMHAGNSEKKRYTFKPD